MKETAMTFGRGNNLTLARMSSWVVLFTESEEWVSAGQGPPATFLSEYFL